MEERSAPDNITDPAWLLRQGTRMLAGRGRSMVVELVARARAASPGDPDIEAVCRILETHKVPRFHATMLQDAARNRVYRAAIEQIVPGRRVLDIGTGSGLLAMMAARAGAASVVACEQDPRLARTAREIIARNGLADRITVIDKPSFALERSRGLDGGVDCVVSEIFSEDLLGEGVLSALAHARAELCDPGAVFLPERASIRIALAQAPATGEPPDEIEGFSLAPFARHLPIRKSIRSDHPKLALRSAPHTAFGFDWTADCDPPASRHAISRLESHGGTVNTIVQWIALHFLPGLSYENTPGSGQRHHWLNPLTPIRQRNSGAGDTVGIRSWYCDEHLTNREI